jgi:hypothetical protein
MRSKIMKKRRLIAPALLSPGSQQPTAQGFTSQDEYERQLTTELAYPRLEKYSSEVLTKNLKVAVEQTKTAKREEVIVHSKSKGGELEPMTRKRRLSLFLTAFEGTRRCIENNWCL